MRICANCGDKENLHIHHIVPRALGGSESNSNKVVLCVACHAKVHGFGPGYVNGWRRGTGSHLSPTQKNLIQELWAAGETNSQISIKLRRSQECIRRARARMGLIGRHGRPRRSAPIQLTRCRLPLSAEERKIRKKRAKVIQKTLWRKHNPEKYRAQQKRENKRWAARYPDKDRKMSRRYRERRAIREGRNIRPYIPRKCQQLELTGLFQ